MVQCYGRFAGLGRKRLLRLHCMVIFGVLPLEAENGFHRVKHFAVLHFLNTIFLAKSD
jgi:hypothetical protein